MRVEQKVGQKLQSSVKSITYTFKSHFKSHLPCGHPSQKPTFSVIAVHTSGQIKILSLSLLCDIISLWHYNNRLSFMVTSLPIVSKCLY